MHPSLFYPFRRRVRISLGLAGLVLIIYGCGGPPGSANAVDRLPEGPEKRMVGAGQMKGVVLAYAGNPGGDIDKVEIKTATGEHWFHFPPHLARDVMALAKINATVTVRYDNSRKKRPGDEAIEYELLQIRSNSLQKEFNLAGVPPPPPRPGSIVVIDGRPSLEQSPGKIRFFVLAGKRIALSSRSAETLLPIIAASSHVIVTGEERDSSDGFVSLDGLPFIRARQLTIDSVKYIIE